MIIHQKQKGNSEEVYQVTQKAFEKAECCDSSGQGLVVAPRKNTACVPELSLAAKENGKVVVHILSTKIHIGDQTELALAPLPALPECQRRGIGTALMACGHQVAAQMGYGFSVILDSEEYYPKAGYVPAEQYGIQVPFDVPSKNYMALDLQGKPRKLSDTAAYAGEFLEAWRENGECIDPGHEELTVGTETTRHDQRGNHLENDRADWWDELGKHGYLLSGHQ